MARSSDCMIYRMGFARLEEVEDDDAICPAEMRRYSQVTGRYPKPSDTCHHEDSGRLVGSKQLTEPPQHWSLYRRVLFSSANGAIGV